MLIKKVNPNDPSSKQISTIQNTIKVIQNDFHKKYPKVIGKGSYGHVILNQVQETGQKYVVKKADKKKSCNINQLNFYKNILPNKQVDEQYYPIIYGTDTDILNSYIVMEYLDPNDGWKSLQDIYIHNFKDNDKNNHKIDVTKYFPKMNEILASFHDKNIIHNDIKNENIMINTTTEEIKFIDYGFSFTEETCGRNIKILQNGTLQYMLPLDEEPNMTEEKIMELGRQKDKFALKVCEFYNFWEKTFLLDIPRMYINSSSLLSSSLHKYQLYQIFYRWLLNKEIVTVSLNEPIHFMKMIYNSNSIFLQQILKFNQIFKDFIDT
jgi:serine/threonine protein kinase